MKLNIKSLIIVIAIVIALIHLISCVSTPKPHKNTECHVPVIVGHRGAPGHAPEHTLHSYKLALDMGADYIEPDLVSTKDGVLISRHENEISGTTNVAEVFPKRKKAKVVDGDKISGWFTEDFTLKEIKRLRARERLPFRSHCEDDQYEIATFEEILQFVEREEKARGRRIGLAPEIKHSTYFSGVGLPLEGRVVDLLRRHHRVSRDSLVMIQSFEVGNLQKLRKMIDVELVQLLDEPQKSPYDKVVARDSLTYLQMAQPQGLKKIREYADWVSPYKGYIVQMNKEGSAYQIHPFVEAAHNVGLKVLPYTFRSDDEYLAKVYENDPGREYKLFFQQNVDGIFSDFADHAVSAKKEYYSGCVK